MRNRKSDPEVQKALLSHRELLKARCTNRSTRSSACYAPPDSLAREERVGCS